MKTQTCKEMIDAGATEAEAVRAKELWEILRPGIKAKTNGRVDTAGGDKTPLGLYRTLKMILERDTKPYFLNYYDMKKTEKTLTGYITRSRLAYERNNHERENYWAGRLEQAVKNIDTGIGIDWPGLYPCFNFKGHDFYTVDSLINELSATTKESEGI